MFDWWPMLTWAWKERKDLGEVARRVNPWLRRRTPEPGDGAADTDRPILFLGAGGVGKSTFAKRLLAEEPGPDYEESFNTERYLVPGRDDSEVEVVVPPGQTQRREATWNSVLADVGVSRYRGILLFNCYGHHSLGVPSYRNTRLFREGPPGLPPADFLSAYAASRREEELEVLRQLAEAVRGVSRRTWLLTVVTKQDLWWPEAEDAQAFYRNGPYATVTDDLSAAVDPAVFRHETVFCSLLIRRMETESGELLRPNAAGYDQVAQAESLGRLLRTFDSLREWEAGS